jgi:hypothetical protein
MQSLERASNSARIPGVLTAVGVFLLLSGVTPPLRAQDLSPRAYVVTPTGTNAVTLSNVFSDGDLLFEGTVPIEGAKGRMNMPSLTYYRALRLFGRSSNFALTQPYGVGSFSGSVLGEEVIADRSGLFDTVVRFAVNLAGAPAMNLAQARAWQQRTLLGASLKVVVPTGQYDPTKLINLGSNRWSFKPEIGLSRRWGHWILDGYAGVWLFTRNPEFFSNNAYVQGTHSQTQDPILAFETHLSYDVRPRLWVSFDANFWYGGKTSVDGTQNPITLQKNSRIGLTASVPISRHHSFKLSYADGAYVRFGGDYKILSAAWQYSWIDGGGR